MKRAFAAMLAIAASAFAASARADGEVHHVPVPDASLGTLRPQMFPTFSWAVLQLLPSPELAFGRQKRIDIDGGVDESVSTALGLRWQLTPLLWSFGVHRSQSRWRYFVVDPLARQSGSIELSTSFEYIGGHVDRLLARPGLRAYFPILAKGESLSVSLGTSVYAYEGLRVAYDVGAYVLSGILGFQLTVAPTHAPLASIVTLRIRYF